MIHHREPHTSDKTHRTNLEGQALGGAENGRGHCVPIGTGSSARHAIGASISL